MNLFTLVARLGMDSSEYEKGISKARGSFSDLGSFVSAKAVAFGTMAAHAIEKAVDAAAKLGQSAIQAAADVEAEQAQFRATFGELQGSAEKAFDAISKSTGIMSTRLQTVGTKVFSQFKGAGLDAVDALGMMEEYTTLAADAAAYYDITLEDADQRLRSFLRGNTEAGDAIGLFTSESQRNTAAMEKYGQKWTALTEAQKQMLMLDISKEIYEQSGAIGQAARESDSWTNITANLKETWRQALALFGKPIKAVITPLIQNVDEWLQDEDVKTKITQFGLSVSNAILAVIRFTTQPPEETIKEIDTWWGVKVWPNVSEKVKAELGINLPEWQDVKVQVSAWWNKTKTKATEGIDFALKFIGIEPWTETESIALKDWWKGAYEKIESICVWWLNVPRMISEANTNQLVNDILAWWEDVKSRFRLTFAITPKVQTYHADVAEAEAEIQQKYGVTTFQNSDTTPGIKEGLEALMGIFDSRAVGIDYVPHNNYLARLHEGEAVLTKSENVDRRNGTSALPIDYTTMGSVIGAAVREALDGAGVYMNGDRVGDLVTDRVSRNITVKAQSRRYQPV